MSRKVDDDVETHWYCCPCTGRAWGASGCGWSRGPWPAAAGSVSARPPLPSGTSSPPLVAAMMGSWRLKLFNVCLLGKCFGNVPYYYQCGAFL